MLLNLALYKLADTSDQVRKHAINLVHWMSTRFFRTQQATARLAKMAQCPERYHKQLYDISELFSEKVCSKSSSSSSSSSSSKEQVLTDRTPLGRSIAASRDSY
jgi:hypothetical protein